MEGRVMEILIWIGAALSLLGVAGLVYCILSALKIRKVQGPNAEAERQMRRIVTVNLAALGLSALGLMLVVVGIFLK